MQNQNVRVRFAPSPTGMLHVGGARTAIFNWAFARACGGKFILRIEDTDEARSTEENTNIILRAMKWLGLDWDEGPEVGGDFGPYFQTQRLDTYNLALVQLINTGNAYPCFCSKEELSFRKDSSIAESGGYSGYDGKCRHIPADEAKRRIDAGEPHVWRLKVPENHPDIEFEDAVYGHMQFPCDVMDDLILVRSDGTPTYNFAVVCDDSNMGITHVIRGDDHLSNTPRQILIYEALKKEIPTFAHLPMILGGDGKKLSKRHGSTNVEEYRDRGYLPECMINFLALLGWSLDGETTIIHKEELAEKFSLERINRKDCIFDETKLDWMNGTYIREMDIEDWVDEAEKFVHQIPDAKDASRDLVKKLHPLIAERMVRFDEIPDKLGYLFAGSEIELDEKSVNKVLLKDNSRADEALHICRDILAESKNDWEFSSLQDKCKEAGNKVELKPKFLFQPLRVAITGNMVSPPLFESIELMNRETVVSRIDNCINEVFED